MEFLVDRKDGYEIVDLREVKWHNVLNVRKR
jgi:hypothetical protein